MSSTPWKQVESDQLLQKFQNALRIWRSFAVFWRTRSTPYLLSFLPTRWWVCWIRAVCPISPKATMPSPLWRGPSSPLLAWRPAAASAWITSRAWRVSPVSPPCRLCPLCPAPSHTAPPPTVRRATPWTMWRPTSMASTDKVRSIDFTFLFSLFTSTNTICNNSNLLTDQFKSNKVSR